MSLPAMKPDRRRFPRVELERLVYIHFEPDNGGIVLNMSEEGICFHAVAPLEVNRKISFSFSVGGASIPAEGFPVWTYPSGKTGGLRFHRLSPEARRQVRICINQSSKPLASPTKVEGPVPRSRSAALAANATRAVMAQSFSQWARGASRWSGFSRGLAAGLLIAVFVAMLFSFHARQRIGDALIWLGERFEPTAKERAASSAARPSVASPAGEALQFRAPVIAAAAASSVSTTRPMARPGAQEPLLATVTKAAPRDRSKPAVAITPAPAVAFSAVESLPLTPVAPTAVPVSPETAQGALAASRDAASGEKVLAATAADRASETENAEDALEINSDMPLGKYFEVGKFKDELAASQILSGLNKLEFQAVVLPKSLLWMKSYEVLVGPYHDEQDAQSARRNLQAQGYKPRSLGKHSRELNVVVPWVNPNGGPEERDDFIVTWEAYSADASVKFVQADKVTRTVAGKWVKLPAKSEYNAIMYTKGKSGTRTLLSIQFRGMNRAVELGSASHRSIVF